MGPPHDGVSALTRQGAYSLYHVRTQREAGLLGVQKRALTKEPN